MPESDDNNPLDSTIERLENIIDDKEEEITSPDIPVLNESADVVTEAPENIQSNVPVLSEEVQFNKEPVDEPGETDDDKISSDHLVQLVDRLETKLSGELEMLINVIKDNMKETIAEEVRAQIDESQNDAEQQSSETDELSTDNDDDPSLHPDGYRPYIVTDEEESDN
jgi:hypothetical protein